MLYVSTPPPPGRRARTVLITERDRRMLEFAAEHRFVVAGQPAALLPVSAGAAEARMRALAGSGYLSRERPLAGQPPSYRITRAGLNEIGSDLPVPRPLNLNLYAHDLGVGWLMVAAHCGQFGPAGAVVSERRMRSDDGRRDRERDIDAWRRQRHGVRLGGAGPGGRERLHYPDMVLLTEAGGRVALELELTGKPRGHRERILAGYAADRRIDRVLYLVAQARVGRGVSQTAARMGISQLVGVEPVPPPPAPAPAAGARGGGPERPGRAGAPRPGAPRPWAQGSGPRSAPEAGR